MRSSIATTLVRKPESVPGRTMTAEAPASEPAGWHAAFQLLFETSATPIAILDERRCVVDLNVAAQQLLGRGCAGAAGGPIAEAVPISERARWEEDWRQLLRDGHMSGTHTLIRADGSEVRVAFAAVIEAVAEGRRAIYTLTPAGSPSHQPARVDLGASALTNRESQVVRLIAGGLGTSDIAETLFVSPNTVRTHVRNAMSKLSARTRAQLVAQTFGCEAQPADAP